MEIQLAECYQSLVTDRTLVVELPLATGRGGLWLVCHRQCIRTGSWKWPVGYFFWLRENAQVQCLKKGCFEPFPRQSITARFNERKTYDLNLFCYCSMPRCSDYMVQCELCEEWLHMSCEGIKTAPEGEWLCTVCRPPDSKRLRNC